MNINTIYNIVEAKVAELIGRAPSPQRLGREHPAGIMYIYEKHTIYESDCGDWEKELNADNYKKYLASKERSEE